MILIDKGYWNAYLNSPYIQNGIGTVGDTYTVKINAVQDIGNGSVFYRQGMRLTLCEDLIYRINISDGSIIEGGIISLPSLPDMSAGLRTTTVGSSTTSAVITYTSDGIIVNAYDVPITGSGGGGSVTWTDITGKPTTLGGYGIVDAYPLSGNPSGFLVSSDLSSYLLSSIAASTYVALAGSYANPSWITSLAWSKITSAPSFITLTSLSGTAPITYNNTTGVIGITQSTTSTNGYLSSTDWNTFNNKQNTITPAALTKVDDTNVTLTLGGSPSTALLQAASLTLGWTGTLADSRIASSSTWNGKQNALSGTGIVKSASGTISYISGTSSQFIKGDGSLDSSTYLTTAVSSVTGTSNRITSTGGTTPIIDISASYVGQTSITTLGTITTGTWQGSAIGDSYVSSASTWNAKENALTFSSPLSRSTNIISIPVGTSSVNGYISSTDWSTFNGKQAALSGTGFVKATGSTISYDNSTYLTTISGISSGGDLTGTYPNPTVAGTVVKSVVLNTTGVLYTNPVTFTTSSNTATGSLALATQTANTVFAGPTTGSAATPTFRAIVVADIPTLNQNTTGNAATVTTNANLTGPVTSVGNTTSLAIDRARQLIPTTVKTANYTAVANDFVPCDNTSGSFTVTLPNAPADMTVIGIKLITLGGTNTITYACSGSDVINKTGGATSGTLSVASQAAYMQYKSSLGVWYIISADIPLGAMDLRYAGINSVVGGDLTGTLPNPTIATVNATPGTYGSATTTNIIAVNNKGQVTSITTTTPTPALTNITGFGAGIATFLATPSSANLAAAVTDETGTGNVVLSASPTFTGTITANAISAGSTINFGGASITLGNSTASSTHNLGTGVSVSGNTKTVNIGTAGASGSTTNINIGSTTSGATNTTTLQGLFKLTNICGNTTLVAGIGTVTITGLTTSSIAFVQNIAPGGTLGTGGYKAVCTANTLTITSISTAGVTNILDTSTVGYIAFNF